MYHNWFESKVRYEKTMENGKVKKVAEPYLVDALSFTEAEARTIEEVTPFISGEFTIMAMKRAAYSETFLFDNGDRFFKCRSRHGSVSFRPSLEHVPHQINAYYTDKNFILLFPDSYAPASHELTFIELHGTRGTYEKKKGWLDFLWKKEEQN